MTIRFKIDEDLPREFAARLVAFGYDAQSVFDENLSGSPDSAIWMAACSERRCLLTADKGFADARRLSGLTHPGVVLFRLQQESRTGYIQLLEQLLAKSEIAALSGSVTIVGPDAIRVRRSSRSQQGDE